MNILEKLGINGLSTYCANDLLMPHNTEIVCLAEEVDILQDNSNEMLEWLIKDLLIQDIMGGLLPDAWRGETEKKFGKEVADWIEYMKPLQIEIVEKATGKSWEEIKSLLQKDI